MGNPGKGGNTGGSGSHKNWTKIYDPRRTKVTTKDVKANSNIGKEGESVAVEIKGAPDKADPSSVPYFEVYSDYRKSAEKAMTREDIPPAYRKRVRDYYDSLR
jgi:hypothetical protein